MARPGRAHRLRRAWALSHLWLGLTVLGLGLANVYIGLGLIHAKAKDVAALSVSSRSLILLFKILSCARVSSHLSKKRNDICTFCQHTACSINQSCVETRKPAVCRPL